MKKLLILTALAILAMSATGCARVRSWWSRGDACNVCDTDYVYDDGVIVAPPSMMPVLPEGSLEVLPTP